MTPSDEAASCHVTALHACMSPLVPLSPAGFLFGGPRVGHALGQYGASPREYASSQGRGSGACAFCRRNVYSEVVGR